jgi:peptidoglycan/LPS O-acetylase OafA/YrhL
MPNALAASPDRYYFLDALRGVAAIAVAFFHCTLPTRISIIPHAGFCVDVFFVLSGFVIAANYQDKLSRGLNGPQFAAARLIRLYPMFLLSLVIGAAGLAWQTALGTTDYAPIELTFAFFYNSAFLPYFNLHTIHMLGTEVPGEIFPFNGPAWSLFFEMLANLLFFLNLRFTRIATGRIVAASLLVFAAIILAQHGEAGWGSKNWFLALPRVTFGFFAGVLIWEQRQSALYHSLRVEVARKPVLWAVLILVGLAVIMTWRLPGAEMVFLAGILLLPLAVAAATAIPVAPRVIPLAVALGVLSYPLYCLHTPILHVVEAINTRYALGLAGSTYISLGLGLSLTLALLAAYGFDEPVRRSLRQHLKKTSPSPTTAAAH